MNSDCNYVMRHPDGTVAGFGYTPDGTYPPGAEPATPGQIAALTPAPTASDLIKQQILSLESQQNDRRVREAVLGADGGWLANLDAQIQALRKQLA